MVKDKVSGGNKGSQSLNRAKGTYTRMECTLVGVFEPKRDKESIWAVGDSPEGDITAWVE